MDLVEHRKFRERFLQQWPNVKRQCMMRAGNHGEGAQCPNEAKFTVVKTNGQAADVCRECLPVACEMATDEVVVKKLSKQ